MSTTRTPMPCERCELPADLQRSVPREVKFTAAGKAVAAIAIALLLGAVLDGPWLYIAASRDAARFKLLESQSVLTQAEVVNLGPTHGEDKRRIITYQYSFQGRTYTGRVDLRHEQWRALRAGSRIDARYVPANPETSWVLGHEPTGVPMWVVAVFPTAEVLAALLIARSLRRQRALLANGRAALAQVTRCDRVRKGDHRVHRVDYEFTILSGATRTGHCDVAKNPPAVGSLLPIVYDWEEPHRQARYPFSLVRVSR